jgi:hypothetical protein
VDVAFGGLLLDTLAAEGRPLLRALRILAMALRAMIKEDAAAGGDSVVLSVIGILALVVASGNLCQPCTVSRGKNCEREHENGQHPEERVAPEAYL